MITIKSIGGFVYCTTPYHPAFPEAAKELGGRWYAPDWVFDFRDELRVRDLCKSLWGTDGHPCELVTLRCIAAKEAWDQDGVMTDRYVCGRLVARVKSKHDDRAKLGQGVVVLSGGFSGVMVTGGFEEEIIATLGFIQ